MCALCVESLYLNTDLNHVKRKNDSDEAIFVGFVAVAVFVSVSRLNQWSESNK